LKAATIRIAACLASLLASTLFCGTVWSKSPPLFKFDLSPGPHAVGLKVIEQYDYSRSYRHVSDDLGRSRAEERARPLQTLVWYPAQRSSAPTLTVGDYLELWSTEMGFGHPQPSMKAKEWRAAMRATLTTHLRAVRDAQAASGRFPVIIYATEIFIGAAGACAGPEAYGQKVVAKDPDNKDLTTVVARTKLQQLSVEH